MLSRELVKLTPYLKWHGVNAELKKAARVT